MTTFSASENAALSMTPAEALAMRDRLAAYLRHVSGDSEPDLDFMADLLIDSGWVTNEPKEKSE